MADESESIPGTLLLKLPFFFLGVAIGMGIVWVSFKWVPGAMLNALAIVNG